MKQPSKAPRSRIGSWHSTDRKDKVVLPDLSSLCPGYRMVGVLIYQPPKNETTLQGTTFTHWILAFYRSEGQGCPARLEQSLPRLQNGGSPNLSAAKE